VPVRKYRYDIWQSQEFTQALSEWDIDGLIIGGVELICCVLYAMLGADERGFTYVVPQDLVSGMRSSEQVASRAVRGYLRSVHPTVERAVDLLNLWPATDSR
jgi:nicotinamidase-related amidase